MSEIDLTGPPRAAVLESLDELMLNHLSSAYVVSWIGLMRTFHGGDVSALMVLAHLLSAPTPLGGFAVSQLSATLGLPRGTVLRKVDGLVKAGFLQARDEGFALVGGQVRTEAAFEVRRAVATRTRLFADEIRRYEPVGWVPGPRELQAADDWALFLASAHLCLRLLREMVPWTDADVLLGVVFLAVRDANTRHLSPRQRASLALNADPSGDLRRPVSIFDMSRELGVGREAIRRQAARLVEGGSCRPVAGGLVANEDIFATGPAQAVNQRNRAHLRRFLAVIATHARIDNSGRS